MDKLLCGSVGCYLSTRSPSQRAVAEEDKGPCREKPGTEELGRSRKLQGEMRDSDRDVNRGRGQGEANCRAGGPTCSLSTSGVQGPEEKHTLPKDTQEV